MWINQLLRVYTPNGAQIHSTTKFIESESNSIWLEVGRGASVVVPLDMHELTVRKSWQTTYDRGNRVYGTVINSHTMTTHILCDFIIESTVIEEKTLQNGIKAVILRVTGRNQIKELADAPVGLRHISKWSRSASNAASIGATTLQMGIADTPIWASTSLVGWTVELADGNWSEIVEHTVDGLLTIDPAWQVNVGDDEADPPPVQRFTLYGAQKTDTSGQYTDLKLAVNGGVPVNTLGPTDWVIHPQSWQTTEEGTFIAPGEGASRLRTLQLIAAQSGEYFVAVPGERAIQWRQSIPPATHPSYGNAILIRSIPPTGTMNYYQEAVMLPGASRRNDGTDVVTRVKPIGAGSGDKALTLRDFVPDGALPSGCSIDGEWLISNTAEQNGYRISKEVRFDGIGPASDSPASVHQAATALFKAALAWLQTHHNERLIFECEVISGVPIMPVSYVYIWSDLYGLQNINTRMYVLDSTVTYREGRVVYKLTLSDTPAPVMTEERLMAEAIRKVDSNIFHITAPSRNSRSLDRAKIGTGGGGDSHEPVTAGNAAIAVAPGQVVSLSLAGPSGLEVAATGLRMADSVAGSGLTISNKVLSLRLATNSGLALTSGQLQLGSAGTLAANTTNQLVGGAHTHAITAFSDGRTNTGELLKSSALGDLALRVLTADEVITPKVETASGPLLLDPAGGAVNVDGNLSFVGARQINTSSGSLTLAPAQTLILDPPDNVVQINPDVTLKTQNWASGFLGTGWGMTYSGELDARKIYADELHVAAFIADTARVKVGSEYVTPSMALLARSFTIPSVGSSGQLYVEDAPGLAELPVFADSDWVLLRIMNRDGGGLLVANVWGQVSNYLDQGDGEQRWTFTTRSTTAAGQVAQRGSVALDFGKSGDGWWWTTSIDPAGAPYAGITTWQGDNPYDEGNRTHRLRMGQLRGVSGVNEWGLRAGPGNSSHIHFSELRNEIHGSRLSLYAGDGAEIRVTAVEIDFYRTAGQFNTLRPDAVHTAQGLVVVGAPTAWQAVDEGTGSPNQNDYIANEDNRSAQVTLGLQNPSSFSNINKVMFKANLRRAGFSSDTIRLYVQVMAADEVTALTAEQLIVTGSSNNNSTNYNVQLTHVPGATQAQWNGARLRIRWEYDINTVSEAIRIDPQVPSLAVGQNLPTGYVTGGDGLWVGRDEGIYRLRIGKAAGTGLRWSGQTMLFYNANNQSVIEMDAAGNSRFTGVMTIGTTGEIRQGTGTVGSDFDGLRLFNSADRGMLAFYGSGVLAAYDNANGLIGHVNGYGSGGGLTNALEIGILASHTTQNRGVSLGANTGSNFSGITAQSGSIDNVRLYTNSVVRATVTDEGLSAVGLLHAGGGMRSSTGVIVGHDIDAIPLAGVVRMKERTVAVGNPPTGTADLYILKRNDRQELYIKFEDGSGFTVAQSTT